MYYEPYLFEAKIADVAWRLLLPDDVLIHPILCVTVEEVS